MQKIDDSSRNHSAAIPISATHSKNATLTQNVSRFNLQTSENSPVQRLALSEGSRFIRFQYSPHFEKDMSSTSSNSNRIRNISISGNEHNIITTYLKRRTCHDLIPTSSKLVVFDIHLPVKTAFYALVANGLRAAPLWSSADQKFIGMLTITDFIMVLRKFYRPSLAKQDKKITIPVKNSFDPNNPHSTLNLGDLEEHTIESWRQLMGTHYKDFVSIDPECSLYNGLCQLLKYKIHRLPIIEANNGNPLYILTHKRILKFIKVCLESTERQRRESECRSGMNSRHTEMSLGLGWNNIENFSKTLTELKIGTYDTKDRKVYKVYEDQHLIEALKLFTDNRVSALPVIERGTDQLVDVYSKFDVLNLAAQRTYNQLDVSIKTALSYRYENGMNRRPLITCTLDENLEWIVRKVVNAEVHRIIVVDKNMRVLGVVSLSDILKQLINREDL